MRTATLAVFALMIATPALAEPPRVAVTVDLSGDTAAAETGAALMDSLTRHAGQTIDLELSIRPRGAEYGLTQHFAADRSSPLACADGFGRIEDGEAFSFHNPGYNHLLLRIFHAPPSEAPRLTAACLYDPANVDQPIFSLSGRYYVSVIQIPTAWDVQLRPVNEK